MPECQYRSAATFFDRLEQNADIWADFFVDNPASGRIMEKCGFRDTGETNYLSHMYRGDERPVKIMRLDYAL